MSRLNFSGRLLNTTWANSALGESKQGAQEKTRIFAWHQFMGRSLVIVGVQEFHISTAFLQLSAAVAAFLSGMDPQSKTVPREAQFWLG